MSKYGEWTLGQIEALINAVGGDEIARAVLRGERKLTVNEIVLQSFLTPAGTIKVRTATEINFSDFFQVNTKKDALVKIRYVGDSFKAGFLQPSVSEEAAPGDGPYRTPGVQKDVATEVNLRYHTLNRRSVDSTIIAELGGEAKAEITRVEFIACLQKQGTLLTNGYANIFYVRDTSGVLRTVVVAWYGDGWHVNACSVENPYEWLAGYRVFSRDS